VIQGTGITSPILENFYDEPEALYAQKRKKREEDE